MGVIGASATARARAVANQAKDRGWVVHNEVLEVLVVAPGGGPHPKA